MNGASRFRGLGVDQHIDAGSMLVTKPEVFRGFRSALKVASVNCNVYVSGEAGRTWKKTAIPPTIR